MYPLSDGYKEEVKSFLRDLNQHSNIEVITNGVSTQVFGEYDDVMNAFQSSLKKSLKGETPIAVISKVINSHLPPDRWDTSQWT